MKLSGGSVPVEVNHAPAVVKRASKNLLRIVVIGDAEKLEMTSELFRLPSLTICLGGFS